MHEVNRQTGQTTSQIQTAPHGAVFIWVTSDLTYPRAIAQRLGRGDLEFVTPSFLERGLSFGSTKKVCVDHAFWRLAYQGGLHRPALDWLREASLLVE